MQITTAKITGNSKGGFWAQVQSFKDETKQDLGELIVVLSLGNNLNESESVEKGKEILETIKQLYFSLEEKTRLSQKLSRIVQNVLSTAEGQNVKENHDSLNIDLMACVLVSGLVYFSRMGKGKIFLARGKKLHKLTKEEKASFSLSGKAQKDDMFIFGTEHFFENIDKDLLQDLISTSNQPRDIADSLTPIIHANNNPQTAGIILTVTDPEDLKISSLAPRSPEQGRRGEGGSLVKKGISLKEKSMTFAQNLIFKIAQKLPEKNISLKINPSTNRRTAISIGIILLILLILSIGFGFKQKKVLEQKSKYEPQLKQATQLLADSILQKQVNPATSKELFSKAQEITQTLLSQGVKDDKLTSLINELELQSPSILGRVEREAKLFLDLSIVRSEVQATKLTLENETLAILDQGGGKVITVAVDGRKTQVLGPHEKTKGALDLTQHSNRILITTNEGVIEVTKTDTKKVIDKDKGLDDTQKVESFSGNLYTLTKKGEVWRYPAIEGGLFGTGKNWFGEDRALAESGKDMSIDGSVWILLEEGSLKKFTRGSLENFRLKGLKSLPQSKAIYTDENLESVYLLDVEGQRILEIDKNGDFQKEYIISEAQETTDFVVSKKAGKIFLLTPTKIYQVDL